MAIKKWHYGKIILLWGWGIGIIIVLLNLLESIENFLIGFPFIILLIGIPVMLSIVTWKWLSGKENCHHQTD